MGDHRKVETQAKPTRQSEVEIQSGDHKAGETGVEATDWWRSRRDTTVLVGFGVKTTTVQQQESQEESGE